MFAICNVYLFCQNYVINIGGGYTNGKTISHSPWQKNAIDNRYTYVKILHYQLSFEIQNRTYFPRQIHRRIATNSKTIEKILNIVSITFLFHEWHKVIETKYSKHWPYTVAHTFDCMCSKINNSWFNPWFSFYFSSLYPAPYIEWHMC